jgi:spore germination protein GerM
LYDRREVSDDQGPVVRANVYFVRDERLVAVSREGRTDRTRAEFALDELLKGPTAEEQQGELKTAIPTGTVRLSVSMSKKVATVNLSREFEGAALEKGFVLRVAQIVWILTELPEVDAVQFRVHWVDTTVIDQDGIAHREVSRARYSHFKPEGDTDVNPCSPAESLEGCETPAAAEGSRT